MYNPLPLSGGRAYYTSMTQDTFFLSFKNGLGTHQTLDPSVPSELGCAEAWSAMAKRAGVTNIPVTGFPGTAGLDVWLFNNPHFERIALPEVGATIISPTVGSQHGHVGVCGNFNAMYNNDWGIISNDSATGIVREQWSYQAWLNHYHVSLGLAVHIYRVKA